jgi:hypothetical protein
MEVLVYNPKAKQQLLCLILSFFAASTAFPQTGESDAKPFIHGNIELYARLAQTPIGNIFGIIGLARLKFERNEFAIMNERKTTFIEGVRVTDKSPSNDITVLELDVEFPNAYEASYFCGYVKNQLLLFVPIQEYYEGAILNAEFQDGGFVLQHSSRLVYISIVYY